MKRWFRRRPHGVTKLILQCLQLRHAVLLVRLSPGDGFPVAVRGVQPYPVVYRVVYGRVVPGQGMGQGSVYGAPYSTGPRYARYPVLYSILYIAPV